MVLFSGTIFSQVKVLSSGDILGKNTSVATARAAIDFNLNDQTRPVAKFGTFGIQSHTNTNAFLASNGYFSAGSWRNYNPGYVHWLHFNGPYTLFRSTSNLPAGGSYPDNSGEVSIVAAHNAKVGISMPITGIVPSYELQVHGNAAKTSGGADWVVISDKRLKKNISSFDDGLETLLKINPVSFEYNGKGGTEDSGEVHVGLIAQEMQKIAPYVVDNFEYQALAVDEIEDENVTKSSSKEYLAIDGSALRYVIINSIKELNEVIEERDQEVSDLRKELETLRNQVESIINGSNSQNVSLSHGGDGQALLKQNFPNPSEGNTTIEYFIPEKSTSAVINFFSVEGKIINTEIISQTGAGKLEVTTSNLAPGVYTYQLIVDGKEIATKKLVQANR